MEMEMKMHLAYTRSGQVVSGSDMWPGQRVSQYLWVSETGLSVTGL